MRSIELLSRRTILVTPTRYFPRWRQHFLNVERCRVAQFLINRVAIDERIYPSSRRGCRVANGDRSNDFSNPQREKFATNCKYITQIGRRSQVQANVTVSAGYVTFLPLFPLFFFSFFFSLSFLRLFLHEANVSRRRPIGGERDEDEARSTTLFRVCSRDPARRSDSFTV